MAKRKTKRRLTGIERTLSSLGRFIDRAVFGKNYRSDEREKQFKERRKRQEKFEW